MSGLFLIIYWCWLFFLCKMFLSCSLISTVCELFFTKEVPCFTLQDIFISDKVLVLALMVDLIFHVLNFNIAFELFTDVDYFSCAKVSLRKFP